MMRVGFVIALLACAGISIEAASFDCARAATPQEKAICADPKLSALDEDTADAYKALRTRLSASAADKVQQDQRELLLWLRQTCPDGKEPGHEMTTCLTQGYSERLQMLKDGLQHVDSMTFVPRLKVLTVPDTKKAPVLGSYDPGFGVGRYSWPEIDRPTPQQAAWNAAVSVRGGEDELGRGRLPAFGK